MEARESIDEQRFAQAMEEIYIAEGSDWFWWFGDEHSSANQDDFDDLFRYHLRTVYEIIGEDPPEELFVPIRRAEHAPSMTAPAGLIYPTIDGLKSSEDEWENAGHFVVAQMSGAMHRAEETEQRVWFGRDEQMFYLRFDLTAPLETGQSVRFTLRSTRQVVVGFSRDGVSIESKIDEQGRVRLVGMSAAVHELLEAAIPLEHFNESGEPPEALGIVCEIFESGHETQRFPQQGEVVLPLGVP
jgi:hypothetical protein